MFLKMQSYELTYIISGILEEKEVSQFKEKVEEYIKKSGGEIINTTLPEKKRLAYSIRKLSDGYFISSKVSMSSNKIDEFKKDLRFSKEMLRYLILKESDVKVKAEKPKKVARKKITKSKIQEKEVSVEVKPEEILEIDKEIEKLIQ